MIIFVRSKVQFLLITNLLDKVSKNLDEIVWSKKNQVLSNI